MLKQVRWSVDAPYRIRAIPFEIFRGADKNVRENIQSAPMGNSNGIALMPPFVSFGDTKIAPLEAVISISFIYMYDNDKNIALFLRDMAATCSIAEDSPFTPSAICYNSPWNELSSTLLTCPIWGEPQQLYELCRAKACIMNLFMSHVTVNLLQNLCRFNVNRNLTTQLYMPVTDYRLGPSGLANLVHYFQIPDL